MGVLVYCKPQTTLHSVLYLDLKRILGDRGITENPIHFLRRAGFTDHMANKLYYNKIDGTSYRNLEKLCIALTCSPNELFSWQAGEGQSLPANHPLQKRKPSAEAGTLGKAIRELPPDQLEELRQFVKGLKSE